MGKIDIDYGFVDIRTSVGVILHWVGKMYESLNPSTRTGGYADIHFEHEGIRIECLDEHGHPLSEETIPVSRLGEFSVLYAGYRYQRVAYRRIYQYDLEKIQVWLSEYPPEQPVTIRLEYDANYVWLALCGQMKSFGVRPEA